MTQVREFDKSVKYFKMCQDIASQSQDSNAILEVLFIGAVRDNNANKYELAKEKMLKVLDYSERHNDTVNIDRIHYHIGSVYFNLKDYERAIFHNLRARDDTPVESFRMHHNITYRLVKIYNRIGMYEKPLEEWKWYYNNHDITIPRTKSLTLSRISDEFLKINQPDSALYYADLGLQVAIEGGVESMEYRGYANKALAHLFNNNISDALYLGMKAYNYFGEERKKSNPLAYRTARKALGGAYKELNNYSKAKKVLIEGLSSSELNRNYTDKKFFVERLLEIAILNNNKEDALNYSNQLAMVNDEIKKQYTDQRLLRIKTEYDIEKKDLKIRLLDSENELKDLEISKSRRNVVYAMIGLALLTLMSFLLYITLRNRKRSQRELQEKNNQISKALADKELLLKEIHHRVKNNLQVVSSLLGLQSEYIKDASALSAINEGRNRVRSMSLIHQNLYKENNLKGIGMKSYLEKLISGLFDTYNINEDKIKLNLSIQDIDLDVDTVVPLGLITNELVSNALKHAFKTKKEGIISVSLQEKGETLELIVNDNGDGLGEREINEEIESFGYQMIYAFKDKLNADLDVNDAHGTSVKLSISEYQKT